MEKIEIQNIVASSSFDITLDLASLHQALEDTKYEPEKFPGLVFRLNEPKCTMLIFRNGKIVCTGAKNAEDIPRAISILANNISKLNFSIERHQKIIIQNIVATYDLGCELNLTKMALEIGLEQVEYEPEQFPGLIYRMKEPKVVMLLFGSGKIVITGGRSIAEVKRAGENIHQLLTKIGHIL